MSIKNFNCASRLSKCAMAAVLAVGLSAQAVTAGSLSEANGAGVTTAAVAPSNQLLSATSVTYTFRLAPQTTASNIKCVSFQTETPQGTAAKPTGMTVGAGSVTVSGIAGGGTWTNDSTGASTGLTKVTNASATTPTNPISIAVAGYTNPSSAGTYYYTVRTFTDTGCSAPSTSGTDSGTMAFVITNSSNTYVDVTARYGQILTFSLSTNAVTLSPDLSPTGISSATGDMTVTTNAQNGYNVTGTGSALTSGGNTINYGTPVNGTSAFALNTQSGCASGATCPAGDFNPNTGGTSVVTRTSQTSGDTTTVTYKASVSATQPSGTYATRLSYVASGQF